MVKGLYQALSEQRKKPSTELKKLQKQRTILWRKQHTVERIEKPTKLARARTLGYKAKPGYALARIKVRKGGRSRRMYRRGRKPSKAGLRKFTPKQSLQAIAEAKAGRRFRNLEVLASYPVGEDGQYKFFEVILIDPNNPHIISDPKINWICQHHGRVFRGLTPAAKRSRK